MSNCRKLSPSRQFVRIVNRVAELLERVENVRTIDAINGGDIPPEPQRGVVEQQLVYANRLVEYLEHETAEALGRGNPVLTGVSEKVRRRYDYIFRNKKRISQAESKVFADSLDLAGADESAEEDVTDAESEEIEQERGIGCSEKKTSGVGKGDIPTGMQADGGTRIRNVLRTWIEDLDNLVESGDIDLSRKENEVIQWAVNADWFDPDAWYDASCNSRLLVLSREHDNVPTWIRHRVKDLYKALFTGNYLAALALARATLEGALDDRADSLLRHLNRRDLDDLRSPRGGGLGKWLNHYERGGIDLPYAGIRREVKARGDEALHGGRKGQKIGPIRARETALASIEITVRSVEVLYQR